MPEASAAIKPVPATPELEKPAAESWVKYNDQRQIDFQKSVKQKLTEAGVPNHDTIPIKEQKPDLLGFIPQGGTVKTDANNKSVEAPETFKTENDDIKHYVDFSGEGAPVRTGTAQELSEAVEARNDAVQQEKNNPTPEKKGFIDNVVDFFMTTKKAA